MALFKIFKGTKEELDQVTKLHEGYAYFCQDTGELFIDVAGDGPLSEGRKQVNANTAEVLVYSTDEGEEYFVKPEDIIQKKSIPTGEMIVGDTENGYKSFKGAGVLYAETEGVPKFGATLPLKFGGTGATTAELARQNLEVFSKTETEQKVAQATTNVYYTEDITPENWISAGEEGFTYTYSNDALRCGVNGNQPPLITFATNQEEYSKIEKAEATAGEGIVFTTKEQPKENMKLIIIDLA